MDIDTPQSKVENISRKACPEQRCRRDAKAAKLVKFQARNPKLETISKRADPT
ncbi:MAG: hypothetical protein ACREQ2_10150 [Candidatus Binatia bacterium]